MTAPLQGAGDLLTLGARLPRTWKQAGLRAPPYSSHRAGHWLWGQWALDAATFSSSIQGRTGGSRGMSVWPPCQGLVNTFLSTTAAAFPHFWTN